MIGSTGLWCREKLKIETSQDLIVGCRLDSATQKVISLLFWRRHGSQNSISQSSRRSVLFGVFGLVHRSQTTLLSAQFLLQVCKTVVRNVRKRRRHQMPEMPNAKQNTSKRWFKRSSNKLLFEWLYRCSCHQRMQEHSTNMRKLWQEELGSVVLFPVLHILLRRMLNVSW